MKRLLVASCALLASAQTFAQAYRPTESFKASKPAFLKILDNGDGTKDLIINAFGPFGGDKITRLKNLNESLASNTFDLTNILTKDIVWPNHTYLAPKNIFGGGYINASGFLIPGKATGNINYIDDQGKVTKLVKKKRGFFYHTVKWYDMNGDGLKDIVTARAKKPIFGSSKGELIWLEQPSDGNPLQIWKEHLITVGPDVNFVLEDITNDGEPEIIATEFFSEKLSVTYKDGSQWKKVIIDDKIKRGFDLEMVDLNNDGKKEILATNHQHNDGSAVFAYEPSADPLKSKWKKHVLLDNIKTLKFGNNEAAPGSAFSFYPYVNETDKKPYIAVAGDGSTKVHILVPDSQDPNNWSYTENVPLKVKGTVGQIDIGDIDNDGQNEIVVPAYDEHTIYILSN